MKRLFLLFLLAGSALLARGQTLAPTVVSSAGGEGSSSNAQIAWTVGESMTETFSTGSMTLTQGFHQPNLIISGIEEETVSDFELNVYPVPFQDELTLDLREVPGEVEVRIFDARGKLVFPGQVFQGRDEHVIDVQKISAGIYFLQVTRSNGNLLKSFKIQKIY